MNYYSITAEELEKVGIREGEVALYTGIVNKRQPRSIGRDTDTDRRNAYVYVWEDGQPVDRDAQFRSVGPGPEVLDVQVGDEKYRFLRAGPFIFQAAGPAAPIVVANFGAIPLLVNTLLGKFSIQAGTMLRLDENAPQREKKTVLLTLSCEQPLKSAAIWDGDGWRQLNIRREPYTIGEGRGFIIFDGAAIVQQAAVNDKGEILLMDSPEPDPDYEIFVRVRAGDWVKLGFDRRTYKEGRIIRRTQVIRSTDWGEPVAYDLQKLKEARTAAEMELCRIKLSELPGPAMAEEAHPVDSDIPEKFPDMEDGPAEEPVVLPEPDEYETNEAEPEGSALDSLLAQLNGGGQKPQAAPAPEPPENFPE